MSTRISPLAPLDISSPPAFEPQSFDDPAKAVDALTELYERNTAFLIDSFATLAKGAPITARHRAFYPQVSIETTSFGHVDSRLSYGHVTSPGVYTTTVTRPKLFRHYLKEQLALLMKSHNVPVIVSNPQRRSRCISPLAKAPMSRPPHRPSWIFRCVISSTRRI